MIILLSFVILCSCHNEEKEGITIGISFETLQTEYWVASMDALKKECAERNIKVIEAVANGDANRQFEQVNNFISKGVDGIIVAPKDAYTVIPIIKAANRANIPIGIYNRMPAKNTGLFTTVVADNYEITKRTVQHICELAKSTNKKHKAMILIGDLGDINAVERRRGFNDAISEYPDVIELVAEVPTEWNQEKALAGATNSLQANPDINLIFTSSDFLFPSLISALKNTGKYHKIGHPDHVLLAGFDGDATAYSLLKNGYLDADGVQDLNLECRELIKAVLGKDSTNKPTVIADPGFVIHQENLSEMAGRMWGAQLQ
ncbi:periplasmic binding protein/LacI transcriptional regulator [Flammeovirgaceae bacterium 311]|nr:periplasmic binding protein/LacI transcriptional regulator [Flammeovirgaceae bacterium 311]